MEQKCHLCDKIGTKIRRHIAEQDRINRWSREGGRFRSSIRSSERFTKALEYEILALKEELQKRADKRGLISAQDIDSVEDRTDKALRQHAQRNSVAGTCKVIPSSDWKLEIKTAQEETNLRRSSPVDAGFECESSPDSSSAITTSDEVFSRRSGSSMTSHIGTEQQAAQDELVLILSEDRELCSLYLEAFRVMRVETFEKRFPNLLKSYCGDLSKEASNDLERNIVPFMKTQSRRHYITRRICETFGPEDDRAAKYAELKTQREERFFILERFLKRVHLRDKETDESFNDSDDEIDFDAGYNFSDVRLVKDFLLGNALTNLQISLRHFVREQDDKAKSTPIASFESNDEAIVAARTSRWNEKTVTIHWQCVSQPINTLSDAIDSLALQKCGKHFQEDVVEPYSGYADELVRQCVLDANESDVEKQEGAAELDGMQDSSSVYPIPTISSASQPTLGPNQPTLEVTLNGEKRVKQELSEQARWILLCLPGREYYKVHHTYVKNARCNKEMYARLHKRYYSNFRSWIRWLTLHKLESVGFIRFHVYWRYNVDIEASDLGSIPPPTSTDYDFDRTAERPPILRTALTDFLVHPSHAPSGTRHLARMPKKIGGMLAIAEEMDEEREGWGLYVREGLCWKKTSLAFGLIRVAALTFAI
ncbi:MAG: hypothetical protein Q9167_007845, partial [Letrouitia subvulpina]